MGASQSVRATAFQRPKATASEPFLDDEPDDHHINISNKMVERLVEDATLAGGAAAASSQSTLHKPRDYRDKILIEKLKCLDESHSELTGMALATAALKYRELKIINNHGRYIPLTANDLSALAVRIDKRTSNMVSVDPICADCKHNVIKCYNEAKSDPDIIKCWDTVGAFTKCVQEAATARLRARTQREARERARRTRHVAHAREHALRDLSSN